MTIPRLFRACLLGLSSLASTACLTGHGQSQAPIPARPTADLVDEIRVRHADLVDAVRLGDSTRLRRNLMTDAMLVTPGGDTVRGIPGITKQLFALRAAKSMETVRGTTGSGVVRCFDGVLERVGEWAISTMAPDSSFKFERGPLGIQWVARGDSLGALLIDMASPTLALERTGCVSVEETRFKGRRFEAFYTFGVFTPASFQKATENRLGSLGYASANSDNPTFPNGATPSAAQIIGVSGRLIDRLWLTVVTPREQENANVGRCNPTTFNYVHVQRAHRPIGLMLDVHLPYGVTAGIGPATAADRYNYQEFDLVRPTPDLSPFFHQCGADVLQTAYDSSDVSRQSTGVAGNMRIQIKMSRHVAITAQLQTFRFPTAPAPMTSRGMSLAFKDFTATVGWGLSVSYWTPIASTPASGGPRVRSP